MEIATTLLRTITKEKRKGLYEKHHTENDTYRSRGLRINLTNKKRVDQIIHTGQQHRDDGRYSHGAYHTMDRRLGQECIFIAHCFILQS